MQISSFLRSSILTLLALLGTTVVLKSQTATYLQQSSQIKVPAQLEADAVELIRSQYRTYSAVPPQSAPGGYNAASDADNVALRLAQLPTEIDVAYDATTRKGIELFLKQKKRMIPSMLSLANYYFPIIESTFDEYDIPTELKYLALIESGLDPSASSGSGAKGLWQFMLPTAKAYGLEVNSLVDERLDPRKSTVAAARHLKDLYRVYGDWLMVIAAYNCGIGNVNKAIRRSGGRCTFRNIYDFLPRQTRDYVPLFVGAFYVMHYHNEYNLQQNDTSLPTDVDTLQINGRYSIASLAQGAEVSEALFRSINPQFKGNFVPGHIRSYAVTLPIAAISRLESSGVLDSASEGDTPRNGKKPILSQVETVSTNPNRSYTVKRGDTLSSIARRHNVSLSALMKANEIKSVKYKLIPGKELAIPEAS